MKIAQISNTNKISRVSTNKAKDYFFLVHLITMIYNNDIFFYKKSSFFNLVYIIYLTVASFEKW